MCRMNGVNLKLLSLKNIGMSLLELSYLLTFLLSLCFRVNVFINIYVCRKCFWYCLYLHFKICIYRVSLSSLVCLLRAIFYYWRIDQRNGGRVKGTNHSQNWLVGVSERRMVYGGRSGNKNENSFEEV